MVDKITRREFVYLAAMFGASAAWSVPFPEPSAVNWRERRDLFPEGVASGDPDSNSVLLWTRRHPIPTPSRKLTVEVSQDPQFRRVVATHTVPISSESDWTCRVLVGGLTPARVYWYRFTDSDGNGSRIGRTMTAPAADDRRPVRFAFVSCQNANLGSQNAYRRMIYEDDRANEDDRLGFVLHLGDFIYELVWYPEDRARYYDRTVRDIVRYQNGEKIHDFHIPTTVDDYRAAYRNYLHDPDLQDARARWPFVPMWDNHEFSWQGWQGLQVFDGKARPAQTRKVAANQAFFEYQPARMVKPSGPSLEVFAPPKVEDLPVKTFDDNGLGQEPNNLTAINSLKGYRKLAWGANVDLLITDERSYRSEDPGGRPEAEKLGDENFPEFVPEEVMQILDGGRAYRRSNPPDVIRWGAVEIPNFRKHESPQTLLGAEQKEWFLDQLRRSTATWKIWGSTTATLEMRADPQNLPSGFYKPWPGEGYASFGGGDMSCAYVEKGEIYDFIHEHGITGFATVAGDRHSFWAGLAAKELPPSGFDPVGVAFVTGLSPRRDSSKHSRIERTRTLHCGPCSCRRLRTISVYNRRSTCFFDTAFVPVSSMKKPEMSARLDSSRTRSFHRIFPSSIWVGMATPSCMQVASRSKRSLFVFRDQSNGQKRKTADRYAIARFIPQSCGQREQLPFCRQGLRREMQTFQSNSTATILWSVRP